MNSREKKNKQFGIFFSIIFILFSIYFYLSADWKFTSIFFLLSFIFIFISFTSPNKLNLLNKIWIKLGNFLGKVISPVILSIIFFSLITPVSLIGRLFKRDILKLKKQKLQSYWINRSQTEISSESFKNQF